MKHPPLKILIAEDERATRARLAACLRDSGHQVVEAADGEQAWQALQEEDIPMVISDWLMPKMDGETLIKRIRERRNAAYVYVILLTSRSDKEDVIAGIDCGADDFMTKPFDNDELRARIRAGMRVIQLEQALAEKNRRLREANDAISRANHRMKDELLAAARIQRSFLPKTLETSPAADFDWIYEPCEELGGDTLNILPFDETRYGIYVVDVAGHGVAAALLSVHLSRLLTDRGGPEALLCQPNGSRPQLTSPAVVAAQLNESFQIDPGSHQFFTLLYGILDLKERTFRYTSAGHPGPLLISEGQATLHAATPPAIGFLPAATFQEYTLHLKPGDRLLLYTDGIFEVDDENGAEWGEDGLARSAAAHAERSLGDSLRTILQNAKDWQKRQAMKDDVSLIGISLPG